MNYLFGSHLTVNKHFVHKRRMLTFPIFDKLGGLDATFDRLKARGFPIKTKDALRMWRAPGRGTIPGDAAVELMKICEAEGIEYAADDFEPVERAAKAAA